MTINIIWKDLVSENVLDDKDRISVIETKDTVPSSQIEIGLLMGPGITYWKGIQLQNIVLCQCQDEQTKNVSTITYSKFKELDLIFWKAKAFGVHTPWYSLPNDNRNGENGKGKNDEMKGGNRYIFEWLRDT